MSLHFVFCRLDGEPLAGKICTFLTDPQMEFAYLLAYLIENNTDYEEELQLELVNHADKTFEWPLPSPPRPPSPADSEWNGEATTNQTDCTNFVHSWDSFAGCHFFLFNRETALRVVSSFHFVWVVRQLCGLSVLFILCEYSHDFGWTKSFQLRLEQTKLVNFGWTKSFQLRLEQTSSVITHRCCQVSTKIPSTKGNTDCFCFLCSRVVLAAWEKVL